MAPGRILLAAALAASLSTGAAAQDASVLEWSQTAARGVFELCKEDAPDAARVAGHGEVWGWPPFAGYTEHPEGYRREAGGESRRTYEAEGESAFVEATVQSGVVTAAAPANVEYFRCNVASDQAIDADLKTYFTGLYGKPATDSGDGVVWLTGAAASPGATGVGPDAEDAALRAVTGGGVGAQGMRIELTHENGLDRAKLTLFLNSPAS